MSFEAFLGGSAAKLSNLDFIFIVPCRTVFAVDRAPFLFLLGAFTSPRFAHFYFYSSSRLTICCCCEAEYR